MELINFLNNHKEDWRAILSNPPYNIEIKDDGDYSILKYTLLKSDMNLELVKECRGTIIRKDENGYKIVCYPFRKFGNYSESYADTSLMDFSRATVQEKVDGSLFKFFFDKGAWKLATNGTINSFKADCGDSTFGDVFYSIIRAHSSIEDFLTHMKTSRTYFFEMVHPLYNQIVVHYPEPAIYFLGCRDMETFEETMFDDEFDDVAWVKRPKYYDCHSLAECVEAAHNMGPDEEGYVVTCYGQKINGSFLRVKVKGDEYLRLHKMRGNGALTVKRVVEMFMDNSLDDYNAFFPQYHGFVMKVVNVIFDLELRMSYAYDACKHLLGDRKEYARAAFKFHPLVRSFLFSRADGHCYSAMEYIQDMRVRSLADYIAMQLDTTGYGVEEDV